MPVWNDPEFIISEDTSVYIGADMQSAKWLVPTYIVLLFSYIGKEEEGLNTIKKTVFLVGVCRVYSLTRDQTQAPCIGSSES